MSGHNVIDFNNAKRQDAPRHTVDADDIRERLHSDVRGFVLWLYSGRAFINKNEARVGNVQGEPGASLSIQLHGKDAGLWKDHATDEGGDLIALYRAWAGYHDNANFILSLKEIAKDYFGDPVEVERSSWQPTPIERIEKNKAKLGTKPREDMVELGAPVATYRYYDTRGNVTASVVRFEPDGTRESKTFRPYCHKTIEGVTKWMPGAPDLRPLYRLPDIATTQTVVLCEGEGCADKLAAVGIPATSAMQGAKAPIDKTDWSPLAGKTVIIWPDNDEPGFAYAKTVSARLTALGCTVLGITPPTDAPNKWDAADCVAEGRDAHAVVASAVAISSAQIETDDALSHSPIDVSELTGDPKPREWLVPDWIPKGVVTILSGDGGVGKTLVIQQLLYAAGLGEQWLGLSVPPTRGLGIFCEDDEDELHRRHNHIKADMGHSSDNPFTDTWIWPRVGYDNLLITFDRDGKPVTTPFFEKIMKHVIAKRIGLLVLDNAADLYGGNEILRVQVNYFIKSVIGAIIKAARDDDFVLTVVLLSHPSQAGRSSGSGESGSTGWNNAVRSRLYLTKPEDGIADQRVLIRKKSNYSAAGDDQKLDLIWKDGVLRNAAGNSEVAVKSIENQIKQIVAAAWDDGRPYHAKKGDGLRFLDGEMVRYFAGRVPVEVVIEAIKNLKHTGEIEVQKEKNVRGYNVKS